MEIHRPVSTSRRTVVLRECPWLLLVIGTALAAFGQAGNGQDCAQCVGNAVPVPPLSTGEWLLTTQVNEVNVLFMAAHKGKAMAELVQGDISVEDDNKPAAAILEFRNGQELPLRVGVAIDTSSSVTSRFRFEQAAASAFFHQAVKREGDLGFVMGFENHVTITQDFVGDPDLLAQGVERLKIGGGTALYDAVRAACQKMVHRHEEDMVARVLVVLSDGRNNAGVVTLERAIDAAQEADVIVYTISTNYQYSTMDQANRDSADMGNSNLRKLAEQTGGRMLTPAAPIDVAKAFVKISDELRSRYSVSYKPADFKPDGHYRKIKIEARKTGERMDIRARKGYYARLASSLSADTEEAEASSTAPSR